MAAMCCKSRFSWTLEDDGKFKLSWKVGIVAAVIMSLVALSVSFAMLSSHLTDQENLANSNVKMSTQQTNLSNATAERQSGCPYWAEQRGYTYISTIDICYFYQKDGMCTTWNAAYDTCANDGGHLLFVPNQETNIWLNRLIRDSGETPFVVFIDGTDKVSENTFKNYRNETIIYTQWGPDEPQGYHSDEDCIGINGYHWVDTGCAETHGLGCGFVCQINTK